MKTLRLLSLSLTTSSFSSCFFLIVLISTFVLSPASAQAEVTSDPAKSAEISKENIPEKSAPFVYVLENRPDPFMPFITEKATAQDTGDPDEIIDKNETLTGMQLFEPGQLSLVALLETGMTKVAMVQDSTGKGYVISEGTKIGKRGAVKSISPNKVIIEETFETRGGKKKFEYTDMVLKKEGEE